jgi:hypothetical protein
MVRNDDFAQASVPTEGANPAFFLAALGFIPAISEASSDVNAPEAASTLDFGILDKLALCSNRFSAAPFSNT